MRFEVIALHLNHILFVLLCPLREQTRLIKFINCSVFARKKNILIVTFIQNEGKERYGAQMIKDFTNILNCENKLCWMLSWHKNKYFTGKQKYFLSRHEVHLYFTVIKKNAFLLFDLHAESDPRMLVLQHRGSGSWTGSDVILFARCLRVPEEEKNQRRKEIERDRKRARAFIRWVKGWLDVSHRHEGNTMKDERIQNRTSDYCDHLSVMTVKTVSSVPGVQHQWVRGHTCFHRVSPVHLSASLDGPQSESRPPEE